MPAGWTGPGQRTPRATGFDSPAGSVTTVAQAATASRWKACSARPVVGTIITGQVVALFRPCATRSMRGGVAALGELSIPGTTEGLAAPHLSKNKSKIQEKTKQMTDTQNTEDLELFDDAKEEFPAKEDLKDRLVAIWVTGKHGTRKSEATGKSYDWYETVTLVMDDGPDGTSFTDLVPSVAAEGKAIRVDALQFSPIGLTARLAPRVTGDKPNTFKPLRGRINSRKNAKKGFSDSWSIGTPTEEDQALSHRYADQVRQISAELKAGLVAKDEDAFE